jgi:hypothetical protein
MNDDTEKQQIIEAIKERTGDLLEKKWEAIEALRVDPEQPFAISFKHRLAFRGDKQIVKSTIGFGLRESESVETTIEDGSQMHLFGDRTQNPGDGNGNGDSSHEQDEESGEEAMSIAAAAASEPDPSPPQKRGRGRPPKPR